MFQGIQQSHKSNMVKSVTRQIKIVNPELDNEEEIREIVGDPEKFQKAVQAKLFGQAHFSLVTAVEDIKEKYDDIVTLEQVPFLLSLRT